MRFLDQTDEQRRETCLLRIERKRELAHAKYVRDQAKRAPRALRPSPDITKQQEMSRVSYHTNKRELARPLAAPRVPVPRALSPEQQRRLAEYQRRHTPLRAQS